MDGLHPLGLDLPRDRARGRDDPADLRRRRPLHDGRRRALHGWLLIRHGTTPFRLGWTRAGSTVLCGVLLIGGERDALRGRAACPDRAGVADLRLRPALARRPALDDRRPAAARLARRNRRRVHRRRASPATRGDATVSGVLLVVAAALSWALGTFLSSRLPMPGDALTTAGIQGIAGGLLLLPIGAAPLGRRVAQPGRLVDPLAARAPLPGRVRLDLRLHRVRLARRKRAARNRRHLRVRQPARRDHARRPLPRRGGDVADRSRRGGDPDLGRGRDPPRGAAAARETIPPLVET